MYNRILVPTDGSSTAEAAFSHALDLADRYDAEIHVIHVINTRRYDTSIESQVAPLRKNGNEYVERLEAKAKKTDVPVTRSIELGRPADEILSSVDAHDIALVVMGTRGRGGLARRVLGSVTNYVVTHANVPIHVVPPVDND